MNKKEFTLRLILRSVYLKGHQDGNMKTTDLSWEDEIINDIEKLYGRDDSKERYVIRPSPAIN